MNRSRAAKHLVRVVVPDSHGAHIDVAARDAMLRDLRTMHVDEVVWLGDHLDCGGVFSTHQRAYTNEIAETFDDDVRSANKLLDLVEKACPDAENHFIYGNHEDHVERWASRTFFSKVDADNFLERQGPAACLGLKERGFRVYRTQETYGGLPTPGVFRLGRCHFTHGWCFGRNATADHLTAAGVSIVHGHTHTAQSSMTRTMASGGAGAWCPGTLARLQPLYRHNAPTRWTHGYLLQLVNRNTQRFMSIPVPIIRGESMLASVEGVFSRKR